MHWRLIRHQRGVVHVWLVVVGKAKDGNMAAIREFLDRTCGKPEDFELEERIQQLEALLERHQSNGVLGSGAARLGS